MVKERRRNPGRTLKKKGRYTALSSDDSDEDYVVEHEENTSEEDDLENFEALEENYSRESIDLPNQSASHARTPKRKYCNRNTGSKDSKKRKPALCDEASSDEDCNLDNNDELNANGIEETDDSEGALKVVVSNRHKKKVRSHNSKRRANKSRYRDIVSDNEDLVIDVVDDSETEEENNKNDDDDDDASIDEENENEEELDDDFFDESEDDDEFIIEEDDDAEDENYKSKRNFISRLGQKKKPGKVGRGKLSSRPKKLRTRRNKTLCKRKNTKDSKKKNNHISITKTRKRSSLVRKRCVSDSNSESDSAFHYTMSEEEREQVKEANKFCGSLISNMTTLSSKKKIAENGRVKRNGKEQSNEVKADMVKQVCGICLSEEEKRRSKGTLNCCSHFFCFACIMEWAKVESRCPLCKQRFQTITKHGRSANGVDLRNVVIDVPQRDQVYQPTEEEIRIIVDPYEDVICTECHEGGDDGLMLLCDICDSPAHTYCVGLGRQVPEGNWYCNGCRPWSHDVPVTSPDERPSLIRTPSHNGVESSGWELSSPPSRYQATIASSPVAGGPAAATLSGRRQILRHIQHLFSNRQSPMPARGEPTIQQTRILVNDPPGAPSTQPLFDSQRWSESPATAHGEPRLVDERSKEELQTMVVTHLVNLSKDANLGDDVFKEIVRSAMHTVLATCGVEDSRSQVQVVPPPTVCVHFDRLQNGDRSMVNGLCSSCFDSFVKDLVKRILDTRLPHWLSLSL